METSAPKRRRTSPRNAVPVRPDADSTGAEGDRPRPAASPNRPSFASPTRASLERFNPEILRRRESQPRELRSSPDAHPPASRAATPDSTASLTRALRTRLELRSGTRDVPVPDSFQSQGGLRSPARRPHPGTTPTRPKPRPLPPPAPEHDEELLRVISGRGMPGRSLGVLPDMVAPEPELPPTPEHPDPVVSTPPSGIHNTPSRRPRKSRALAERLKSSSPLKRPPSGTLDISEQGVPLDFSPSKKKKVQAHSVAPTQPEPTTAELRGLKPVDPNAEKRKLRDSLLAELSQLERDVDVARKENERIRRARLSRREPSPPSNERDILDLLARHVLPPEDRSTKADALEDWLSSALNPIAFLPFSKGPLSGSLGLPPHSQTQNEPELPPPVSHDPLPMTADEALPYLQVFTPLTFASHISPLPPSPAATDADGEHNDESDEKPILQQHTITASSASPRGLFTARIEMCVNTKTMSITRLAVPRLEPAAAAELGPFVDSVVGGGSSDSSSSSSGLHNNVSVLGWAMGEWVRVATQRARVWITLEREARAGKEALREMVARLRAGRKGDEARRKKRRRKRWVETVETDRDGEGEELDEGQEAEQRADRHATQVDGDEREAGETDKGTGGTGTYGAANLLPHMGRTSMDLEIPVLDGGKGESSMLRVQWRIAFDWTGEAKSDIGVLVGVPGKWRKHDERGQLSGLPKLFDDLIQGGEEPLAAVRTVVCLLAGEQRS